MNKKKDQIFRKKMSRMQSGFGGGSRGASRGFGGGGGGFGGDRDRYGGGGYGGGGARGKSMAGDNLRKVKWDNYTLVSSIWYLKYIYETWCDEQ